MNIKEFNDKVIAVSKELWGENYNFSSTAVDSTNYSHMPTETIYRATVFFHCGHPSSVSVKSEDYNCIEELLRAEHRKNNTVQTHISL